MSEKIISLDEFRIKKDAEELERKEKEETDLKIKERIKERETEITSANLTLKNITTADLFELIDLLKELREEKGVEFEVENFKTNSDNPIIVQEENSQSGFAPIQIILSILAGTIVLGGIVGGVLYFEKQELPVGQQNKTQDQGYCGDGVCDDIEKGRGGVCSDCKIPPTQKMEEPTTEQPPTPPTQPSTTTQQFKTSGSPFGIGVKGSQDISYAQDLGFKSVRIAGISGAVWDVVKKNGFSQLDSVVSGISKDSLEIFLVVLGGNPAHSNDLGGYGAFIASIVERYDGDGKDDASGSPKITYLEIDNEPDLLEDPNEKTEWKGDLSEAGDYAQVLKTAYESAKSANPKIKVAIAGMAYNLDYYEAIFKELEKLKTINDDKFFDVFNYHYYGGFDQYGAIKTVKDTGDKSPGQAHPAWSDIQNLLKKYSYNNIEIAVTETGNVISPSSVNTEKLQATSLAKKYIYPIAHGVDKVLWLKLVSDVSGGPFSSLALMSSGQEKRLNYYTYKKMVEVLDGSDWNNTQTIQEKDGVYIYKFTKADKPIWVAWNDNTESKSVTISDITANSVKITEAIPKYESGKEVTNYSTAFNAETKTVSGGKVTITLKDKPVFVE